jgi:phosphate transport system permease protein
MNALASTEYRSRLVRRKRMGTLFIVIALLATSTAILFLSLLLVDILMDGLASVDLQFITSFPSSRPEKAGILPGLVGTLWVLAITALLAFPIGVGAAVYLEEYSHQSRLNNLIQTNISNLAGVPSIVYGLLGLGVFVRLFQMGSSILAAGITMALLILPVVIIASREAIRAVPVSLRYGSLALGASLWQTIWRVVLPNAIPGILTGTILALSRAIGETAPLIVVGAVTYITYLPSAGAVGLAGALQSQFTTLPIMIYNWTSRPQQAFHDLAAAGIIVLLVLLLSANALAIVLRNRMQKRY